MRLLKAEITAFGKWRNQVFDFERSNQLFYGSNEAGKSTLYQFICAMLFGFPTKNKKKKDYTPKDGAAFGGKLWLELPLHGEVIIERYRQQNKGQAKVTLDERVGDERLLKQLLAPLTKELFQQVFTFQQEQLTELDLLKENELHESLISLGISGSTNLFQKKQEYLGQAQQLFKKKGQKLPLNQALVDWQLLQQQIQRKQAQEAEFGELIRQQQQLEKEYKQTKRLLEEEEKKLSALRQQQVNFPLYKEWLHLKSLLKQPTLTESQKIALQDVYLKQQQLAGQLEELEQQLEKHSGMDQQSARYYFYLENEEKIQALVEQQVDVQLLVEEQARFVQKYQETTFELSRMEQQWQWVAERPPVPVDQTVLSELVTKSHQLEESRMQGMVRKEMIKEQRDQLEEEVNQFETNHPELFQRDNKTTKVSPIPWIVASLSFVGGLFLGGVLRWGCFALMVAGLISGVYPLVRKQKASPQLIKEQWQEKLNQLDIYEGKLAQELAQEQMINDQLANENVRLLTYIEDHHLGQMNTYSLIQENYYQVTQYLEGLQEQQKIREKNRQQQQQLDKWAADCQFLQEWLPFQEKSLSEKMAIINQFAKEMEQLKFAQSYQQNTLLKQQMNQVRRKQKEALAEQTDLFKETGIAYLSEIPARLQQEEEGQKNRSRYEELTQTIGQLFPEELTEGGLNELMETVSTSKKVLNEQATRLSELRQRNKIQVETLQSDGTLDQLYQEESQQKAALLALANKWSALELTAVFLGDLSTELSERQLPELLKRAGEYLGILTDNKYNKLTLEAEILTVVSHQQSFSVYELSTGTKDQLMMAIRFAYLSLEGDRKLSPVMIDDGWLHYDHQRKYCLAKLLDEFSKKYQVICFSSDKEMVSYYQELNQPVIRIGD
ncbi:hypothetical protein IGI37_003498 [Enterococcus sp. AZ194]|uniref:ATP-binding protein n=1 Tax=Enterococcus sp. AZ194 TaxID=2774629 RepID=UPI003F22BA1D